jgi:hypothetical protein
MSASWGPFPPVHQQAHAGLSQGTLSRRDQRDDLAAGALISNQVFHRQDQKPDAAKMPKIRAIFLTRGSRRQQAAARWPSWLGANHLRSLRNFKTRKSTVLLAAISAGLPRDRARKPAQDAAWRNRARATCEFSDGGRAYPTWSRCQEPSTRKPHTRRRQLVLDGRRIHTNADVRCQRR